MSFDMLENMEPVAQTPEVVEPLQVQELPGEQDKPDLQDFLDMMEAEPVEQFQNPIYTDMNKPLSAQDFAGDGYSGVSIDKLERDVQKAQQDLEKAEANLQWAMENGVGVITAMNLVESCSRLVDTRTRAYNEAVAAQAGGDASMGVKEASGDTNMKFGSVSHAQWELERAIESGNSIAIENRRRDLAREIAREEANKMKP